MAVIQKYCSPVLFVFLFLFSELHFSFSKPSGFSLKLIPRDSPESPLYPGNLTQLERLQRLVRFSKAKDNYLKLLSSPNATILDPDFFANVARDLFYYVAQIQIGTPPVTMLLVVDTGGNMIWTQCEPCINCYRQAYPRYDSRASSTYRKLPCDHPFCSGGPGTLYSCVNGECIFSLSYGGGTSGPAKGFASLDSFTFPTDANDNVITLENIIFGCAVDNQNFDQFARNGLIAGIAGLNLSPDSLFVQLLDQIDRRFSYCVIPFSRTIVAPTFLRFGNDIPPVPENVKTTPVYAVTGMYYHFLQLEDISVGSLRLNFPPGTFQVRQGGNTLGFFIDSGAPITLLDTDSNGVNTFQVVLDAFRTYYDSLRLERFPEEIDTLKLCYRVNQGFNNFVSMTYHLQGADYVLDGKYVNVLYDRNGPVFCPGILPGQWASVLGAVHQQNMRIIHDARGSQGQVLQFYNEDCAAEVLN
ncbi:aspartic proteinase nepenthesin-2-like [Melia azedarach]|uniref:Aspartic proteinase nepenthesin-2-like n=1 Tax=Melia azedarach TaxID=155640 RepID=A0ACC1YSH8_MELAZ|nr:aspartic proteinase nepenthesin-2-like [Melia azedarach]